MLKSSVNELFICYAIIISVQLKIVVNDLANRIVVDVFLKLKLDRSY